MTIGFFTEFQELARFPTHLDGSLELANERTMSNPVCGDLVRAEVQCRDGVVTQFRYNAKGCWPVFGCLEVLAGRLEDKPLREAVGLSLQDFLALVKDVPPGKKHAFGLAYRAVMRSVGEALLTSGRDHAKNVGPASKERL